MTDYKGEIKRHIFPKKKRKKQGFVARKIWRNENFFVSLHRH